MDPIAAVGMQGALVAQVDIVSPPAADAVDATRFAEMVQPPLAAAEPASATIVAGAAPTGTPGDSILNGMNALGEDFRSAWGAMKTALAQPMETLTLADMLRLQMQMMQLSVQVDLVGKAISKATQNVDQLGRLQ